MRAARYGGIEPDPDQTDLMSVYGEWLASEAVTAGGIGPGETERIDLRHLADSVLFLSQVPSTTHQVLDLGSGAGLPGIPIAICRPDLEVVLVDRSRRRVDLMRRAIRILGLDNCRVLQSDVHTLDGEWETIVSRASLPPAQLATVIRPLLTSDGVAVVAGSWERPPEESEWEVVEIPPDVLDHTIWLLIMRRE